MTGPVPPTPDATPNPVPDAAPTPMTPPPAPPPAMPAPHGRPGLVTGAGIAMIVMGGLITLLGLLTLLLGGLFGGVAGAIEFRAPGFGGFAGLAAGILIVFAVILLAIGILDIVAGANVLGRRGWARITGIVLAVILGLISLGGIGGANGSGTFSVVWLVVNGFIIWALATTGGWFAARSG